jgi:peroxiredoxin
MVPMHHIFCVIFEEDGNPSKGYCFKNGGVILESSLKVGDAAPDFSLPATTKDPLSLSEYRGKTNVVVAFYGMDFTPG